MGRALSLSLSRCSRFLTALAQFHSNRSRLIRRRPIQSGPSATLLCNTLSVSIIHILNCQSLCWTSQVPIRQARGQVRLARTHAQGPGSGATMRTVQRGSWQPTLDNLRSSSPTRLLQPCYQRLVVIETRRWVIRVIRASETSRR